MVRTIFAHRVATVAVARSSAYRSVDIVLTPADNREPATSVVAFDDDRAPAVTVDGIDAIALLDAVRLAVQRLDNALEGDPTNVPGDVTVARDALAQALGLPARASTTPTTTEV